METKIKEKIKSLFEDERGNECIWYLDRIIYQIECLIEDENLSDEDLRFLIKVNNDLTCASFSLENLREKAK